MNLDRTPKPGDVYTGILKLVKVELEKDEDPKNEEIVKVLKGSVD